MTRDALVFLLPYPPSVNHLYSRARNGRVFLNKEAVDFKHQVQLLLMRQNFGPPRSGPINLEIHAYRPRKIGDIDNILKITLDSLEKVIYVNDNQIVGLMLKRYDDKYAPRLLVRVTDAEPAIDPVPVKKKRVLRVHVPSSASA
jgi:Holliday junction resolvase RusA-like endonuclease